SAATIVRRNSAAFEKGVSPLTEEEILKSLGAAPIPGDKVQTIQIGERNPFVKSIEIDWNKDQLQIILHPEVNSIRALDAKSEVEAIRQEKLNKLLFNEIAAASRSSDETIKPSLTSFGVTLNKLTNSTSLLTLDIGKIAEMES